MNRILYLFFAIIVANTSLIAQLKVKDSSEKNQPEWINNNESGSIVSKGLGITIDEAIDEAMLSLKSYIKENAVNQMLNENNYLKSKGLNKVIASNIIEGSIFYSNIKADGSTGMYWELIRDKKTKIETYKYYLKYPLNKADVNSFVEKYADRKISLELDALENRLSSFNTITGLGQVGTELIQLSLLISDESKNKVRCEELVKKVETVFAQIKITPMRQVPGKIIVYLIFEERVLESMVPPSLISNCAELLKTERSVDHWVVVYNYEQCKSDKPLLFTLEFDNGLYKISQEFEVNTNDEIVEVKLSNREMLITGNDLTFFVSSRYRSNLIIERMIIHYNGLHFTNTPMKQVLNGAGLYDITFNLPPDFHVVKVDSLIRGELYYKTEKTGQKGVCRFYNQAIKRQ